MGNLKDQLTSELDKYKGIDGHEAMQKILDEIEEKVNKIKDEVNSELKKKLDDHKLWLDSEGKEGTRLVMTGEIVKDLFESRSKLVSERESSLIFGTSLLNAGGISFRNANLKKAGFKGANFYKIDLYGADLSEADLRNSDLCKVELDNTDLTDANIYGAKIDSRTRIQKKNLIKAHGCEKLIIEDGTFKKEFDKEMSIYLLLNNKIKEKK